MDPMDIASATENPYSPATDAEREALARFMGSSPATHSRSLRSALKAGIMANPENSEAPDEGELISIWSSFIDADLKIARSYPEPADAFVAGYRSSTAK